MSSSSTRRRRRSLLQWLLFLPPGHQHSFWPGIFVTVAVTFVNAVCQHSGVYKRFEWADLDRLLAANTAEYSRIVLVTIGDEDYVNASLFDTQRPLKADVLIRLIAGACQLKPAAVGVDIFTDTWTDTHREALSSQVPKDCDVAWARDATPIENSPDHFRLGATAGGAAASDPLCSGLTLFQPSPDGVVRDYLLQVLVRDDRSANSVAARYATLASAMGTRGTACGFSGSLPGDADRAAKIRFSSRAGFRRIPAGVLAEAGKEPDGPVMQSMRAMDPASQAFVLIGGTFRDGRDFYMTPIGSLPGVEVIAHALATAKSNRPIRDDSWLLSLTVDLIVGISLVGLVRALKLRLLWGIALSLTLAVAATFGICYFLFSYFGYFLSVFVSTAGAALGAIVDMTWQPMRRQFDAFRAEYRQRSHGGS